MNAATLNGSERGLVLAALATERETQKREQTRVRFHGHAWHGRQTIIDQCDALAARLTQTESEQTENDDATT